jgi:hypothetical protein
MIGRIVSIATLVVLAGGIPDAGVVAQNTKPPAVGEDAPASRSTGQPVNVKVDLTISEQRDGQAATPRTTSLIVADRERAQIRSTGIGGQALNVDARPEILQNARLRVFLNLSYRGPQTDSDKAPPNLTQSTSSLVEDGKPLVITQWSEMGSSRTVRVELRASIQR